MATVTVTKTPPVEPVIEKVTLELSEEEAVLVLGLLGRTVSDGTFYSDLLDSLGGCYFSPERTALRKRASKLADEALAI